VFDQVPPDSSLETVNTVARLFNEKGCDGFIALGGGSVIDNAKGAAASVSYQGQNIETLQGAEIMQHDLLPLIAIPTTAGTGSEVTLVAVLADKINHVKLSFTSYKLIPAVAILDPALTATLPPLLSATTAIDALTHAVEAYTSIQKNPVSDAFAKEALQLIYRNIPIACREPQNTEARMSLALGSLMAGAAFSNAMVGIVHAIGHALGGLYHVPHAQAMTILLPHCVHFNIENNSHNHLYGQLLRELSEEKYCRTETHERPKVFSALLFEMNEQLNKEFQIPIRLKEVGIKESSLASVAHAARYDGAALYNESEFTEDDALKILKEAF
jgi:alcohol dehydrogenase